MRPRVEGELSPIQRTALLLIALEATLTISTALPTGPFRTAVVLPIALLLPGYGLVAALLGPGIERTSALGAAAVSSIAFYALASLVLYSASVRMTSGSIVVSVDLFVLAAVLVMLFRFRGESVVAGDVAIVSSWRDGARVAAFVALSALLVAATFAARRGFRAPPPAPFTQFAFAGRWQHLSAAPRLGAGRQLRVTLEVTNHTNGLQRYRIVPTVAGRRWSRRDLSLAPGQRWLGSIGGAVPRRPCLQRLTVMLETVPQNRRVTQLALELRRPSSTCVRGSAG